MIPNLPIYISVSFLIITFYALFLFEKSNKLKNSIKTLIIFWIVFISVMAYNGVYHYSEGDVFSRFLFVLLPVAIFIIFLVKSNAVYQKRDLRWSTAVHTLRFPVELLLFQLAMHKWVPIEMTYEGWNYDIIPGITSIVLVILLNFKKVSDKLLLYWNIMGLVFILFILTNGFLSQELLYTKFGYSIPNRGIAYFPIILLAGVIVPIVIYTHITDIIVLRNKIKRDLKKTPLF